MNSRGRKASFYTILFSCLEYYVRHHVIMEKRWTLTLTTKEEDGRVESSDISEFARTLYTHGLSIKDDATSETRDRDLCSLELSGTCPWAPDVPDEVILASIARSIRESIIQALGKNV